MHVAGAFSDDIAIDLGTANTLVHAAGRGVIIDEPSVVAVSARGVSRDVLAVGQQARTLAQREPASVDLIRPLRDGVIADFVATTEMLRQFISRTKSLFGFRGPRLLIAAPAGVTPVERRAVIETARSVGARRVHLIEEPVAAALGAGLDIDDEAGVLAVDIGGGTTDIAALARGGVVETRSFRRAGVAMDEAIARYLRREHGLIIGEEAAERIKIEAGTASRDAADRGVEARIRGQEIWDGRFKSVVMLPREVAAALEATIDEIAEFITRTIDDLPASVARGVAERGAYLTGGGALLDGLDLELEKRTGVPFLKPINPTHCVVIGAAAVLADLEKNARLLIDV